MKTVEQRLADLELVIFGQHHQSLPQVPMPKVMPEVPWDEWCAQMCACGHPRQEHTGKSADGSCNGAGRPCGCESFGHAPKAGAVEAQTKGEDLIQGYIDDIVRLEGTIASMRSVVEAAVEWWADTPQAVPMLLKAIKVYQQQVLTSVGCLACNSDRSHTCDMAGAQTDFEAANTALFKIMALVEHDSPAYRAAADAYVPPQASSSRLGQDVTSTDVCQRCALISSGEIVGTCTLHS